MLEVDQVHECKKLFGQGVPIREISRRTGLSRNSVRRYARDGAMPGEYRLVGGRPTPVRDQVYAKIEALLKAEREAGTRRKQRLTGSQICRILADQYGIRCAETTVRKLKREIERAHRDPVHFAYVPLVFDAGEDAQVDFFEAVVDFAGSGPRLVPFLVVRACFSGWMQVYAAPNQTREALIEGLQRAFGVFGGIFARLWFDNLKPVVKAILRRGGRELQRGFEVFQAHYGFDAEFCRPACGNDKGAVENTVKYLERAMLAPIPKVKDRAELQQLCDDFCRKELSRTMRGRKQSIGELWSLESSDLMPLPATRFDCASSATSKVSNRSWISHGTNYYSVPVDLVGREVQVKIDAERVRIFAGSSRVAEHQRLHGREQMSLQIEHYLPLLEKKLRAVGHALPVRLWLEQHASCWRTLLHDLRRERGPYEGSADFVAAIKMCATHGVDQVTRAVERALSSPYVSLAAIRYHLGERQAIERPRDIQVEYEGPVVRAVSPEVYNDMLEVTRG